MKQFMEALRSARKIELCLAAGAIALLLVLLLGLQFPGGEGADTPEARMERILCEIEGAGRVRVMLSSDAQGICTGAVVASSGAGNIAVRLELERAVRVLTGLELEKIEIVKSQ